MTEPTETLSTNTTIEMLAAALVVQGHAPSKAKARAALAATFDAIGNVVRNGASVRIKGFGCIAAVDTPARTGRNPKTGEVHTIPARKRIKFKPSKNLLGGKEGAE